MIGTELVLVLAPVAVLCIFVLDWALCRIRPGDAVHWGPFQHGVVMQAPGFDGYATVRHAASGTTFAVRAADLRPVEW